MIPQNNGSQVISTLKGERHEFTINVEGGHVMNMLARLYTNRELAILREYSTNGRDAHVRAGNSAPIDVTLPTMLDARLVVRDYGSGMTLDEVTGTFTEFGSSTKRHTNDEQGFLGFGSKSAFAYTNQFTLMSIKDGVKVLAAVAREDKVPVLTVIDTCSTDEPDGTEITIPCTQGQHHRFYDIADRFYRWWDEGTVRCRKGSDGEWYVPARIEGMKVGDDMLVIEGGYDYVVMGGVAYRTDERLNTGLPHDKGLAAFVPNGSVEFVPSREGLEYTMVTRDYLKTIEDNYTKNIEKAVQEAISTAATPRDAVRLMMDWHKLSSKMAWPKYKGHELPKTIQGPFVIAPYNKPTYGRGLGASSTPVLDVSYIPEAMFVYNYDVTFTGAHRKKLKMWCNNKGINPKHFVFSLANHSKNLWLKDSVHVDWDEIKKIKLPSSGGGGHGNYNYKSGPKGSYDEVWTRAGRKTYVEAANIDSSKPIYYVTKYTNNGVYTPVAELLTEIQDCTVVWLTANRINKFCRDFPKAKDPQKKLQAHYNKVVKSLTPADMLPNVIERQYGLRDKLRVLKADKVDDPEVKAAIDALESKQTKRYTQYRTLKTLMNYYIDTRTIQPPSATFKDPLTKYSIIEQLSYYDMRRCLDDIYLYMNAKYKESK